MVAPVVVLKSTGRPKIKEFGWLISPDARVIEEALKVTAEIACDE
jgi:hypothetical protein